MRYRNLFRISLAAFLFAGAVHAQIPRGNAMPADAAPNAKRLIVTYQDGPTSPAAQAANAKVGSIFVRPMGAGKAAVVTLPPDADLDQAMTVLKSQPGVIHVEIDANRRVDPVRGPKLDGN